MENWSFRVKSWPHLARSARYSSVKLAVLCGVSQRQLQRHFHDIFGLKLGEWLTELRLSDATQLLPNHSVKETAYLLGFKTSSHFSREFKNLHGISPRQFGESKPMANPQFESEFQNN